MQYVTTPKTWISKKKQVLFDMYLPLKFIPSHISFKIIPKNSGPFFWKTECELANVLTPLCQQKNNSEIYFASVRSCSTCSHVVCPSGVNILVYLLNILKWNNRIVHIFFIIAIKKGCPLHCPYIIFSYWSKLHNQWKLHLQL